MPCNVWLFANLKSIKMYPVRRCTCHPGRFISSFTGIKTSAKKDINQISTKIDAVPPSIITRQQNSETIYKLGTKYAESLTEQFHNEELGFVEIENILPDKVKSQHQMKQNEQPLLFYNGWKYQFCEELKKNIDNDEIGDVKKAFKLVDIEVLTSSIMVMLLDSLLVNKQGLPLYYIVKSMYNEWLRHISHNYFKKHSLLSSMKMAHLDFLKQLDEGYIVNNFIENYRKSAMKTDPRLLQKNNFRQPKDTQLNVTQTLFKCLLDSAPSYNKKPALKIILRAEKKKKKKGKKEGKSEKDGVDDDERVLYGVIERKVVEMLQTLAYDAKFFKVPIWKIPMLVPAVPIYLYQRGGLITEHCYQLIRGQISPLNNRVNEEQYEKGHLDRFLNILSSSGLIGWKINKRILDIQLKLFNDNVYNKNLHFYNYCRFPQDKEWLRELVFGSKKGEAKKEELSDRDRKVLEKKAKELYSLWSYLHQNLVVANHFRDRVFYLPFNLDFRGRFYPSPTLLHYYSSDNYRALLKFAIKRPLGIKGLTILKLHLCNMMGSYKLMSTSEQISVVDKMVPAILQAAENPLEYTWWMEKDEPWQTLAACIEIANAIKSGDPSSYICGLPVHQDGTCNGLQHYAAIGRSLEEGSFVNFMPRHFNTDLYSEVSDLIQLHGFMNITDEKMRKDWTTTATREVLKPTIMTQVYGVTAYGAKRQIASKIKNLPGFTLKEKEETIACLSRHFATLTLHLVGLAFRNAENIMAWLKSYARMFRSENIHAQWTTMFGLIVIQPYEKKKTNKQLIFVNTDDQLKLEHPLNKLKQVNAFPPNFVHSLDSCHMAMTQEWCLKEKMAFAAIHDSFWTHPSSVPQMNQVIFYLTDST
ncbi:DNA-directed RNA polymerase, mitochondrial [Thelohanellus kitauei]|uniref:DNA-directed RNA polymerase n=1 Tax=Thelohanellus kitauei TaxID=669202 RepID=A0A0C2MUQ8_THEKT|nr:DNA-directed RNA polymerase, mitochondrial [Thelohanellus kitauei]